jgi:hypothetical protein
MFKEPRNRFQGIDSASLCSLVALVRQIGFVPARQTPDWESIPGLLKRFTNSGPGTVPFSCEEENGLYQDTVELVHI